MPISVPDLRSDGTATKEHDVSPKATVPSLNTTARVQPRHGDGGVFRYNPDSQRQSNFNELHQQWKKTRDPDTASTLLKELRPAMESSVYRHTRQKDALTMSQAKRLLLNSLDSYDPKKSSPQTFVDRQLQPLIRWQRERSRAVHVPERMLSDSAKIYAAEQELLAETGREPSTLQVADYTGLSQRRIAAVRQQVKQERPSSLQVGEDERDQLEGYVSGSESKTHKAWIQFVRNDLSDTDQVILEHTLGLDGKPVLTNAALAKRLKISPGAVTQRKSRIQTLLDQEDQLSPFKS